MIRCLHCRAETSNGLALCDLCQRLARECLAMLPVYFRNLARWQPGRAGSRPVPGSRVLYMGEVRDADRTGDKISDTLDEANTFLVKRAEELAEARPYLARMLDRLSAARKAEQIDEAQAVAWLCRGFEKYLASISTLDWCGEFVQNLSHHEERLRRLTEASIPGWYAGGCKRCESGIYVVPGLTWVTCAGCGATTHVGDHREVILDEARSWVAAPRWIAEAVVALVDTEASVPRMYERIKKWEQREQIRSFQNVTRGYTWSDELERPVVTDELTGAKRYQLGDVLDLLAATPRRAVVVKAC